MDMKQAGAVSLIAFVAACLVVLIARALDNQAASQVEGKLDAIVAELRALREGGGVSITPGAAVPSTSSVGTLDNGLMVYYFHGTRCSTCRDIEALAHKTVSTDFAPQIASGEMVWKVLDYREAANKELVTKFGVSTAAVVLAKMQDGKIVDSKQLYGVWSKVGDKPKFIDYVRTEIDAIRSVVPVEEKTPEETAVAPDTIPLPETPPLPDTNNDPPLPDTM